MIFRKGKKNSKILNPDQGIKPKNNADLENNEEDENGEGRVSRKHSKIEDIPENQNTKGDEREDNIHERWMETFFRVYWNNWIYNAKFYILIFIIIWVAIAIWRIYLFEPAKEVIKMLPDNHYLTKLELSLRNDYHTGEYDYTIQISFLWGVKGINKKGVSKWDSFDRGSIIWDDKFDMSSPINQQRLIDICDELLQSPLVKDKKVTCWVKDFLKSANGGTLGTIPQANFYTALETYLTTTEGQNYYSDNTIGYMNKTLYFMKLEALAIAKPFQGYEATYPEYKKWEALKDDFNKNSGEGINN